RYSWFHKSHLTIHEILTLTYYWWSEISQKYVENDLDVGMLLLFYVVPPISPQPVTSTHHLNPSPQPFTSTLHLNLAIFLAPSSGQYK
ncbi:Uncharacterized protein APZ42_000966, partial [Daphnia magna]